MYINPLEITAKREKKYFIREFLEILLLRASIQKIMANLFIVSFNECKLLESCTLVKFRQPNIYLIYRVTSELAATISSFRKNKNITKILKSM